MCGAFVVVARFIDDNGSIHQILVAISMIDDQLVGITTAREIFTIIMVKLAVTDGSLLQLLCVTEHLSMMWQWSDCQEIFHLQKTSSAFHIHLTMWVISSGVTL